MSRSSQHRLVTGMQAKGCCLLFADFTMVLWNAPLCRPPTRSARTEVSACSASRQAFSASSAPPPPSSTFALAARKRSTSCSYHTKRRVLSLGACMCSYMVRPTSMSSASACMLPACTPLKTLLGACSLKDTSLGFEGKLLPFSCDGSTAHSLSINTFAAVLFVTFLAYRGGQPHCLHSESSVQCVHSAGCTTHKAGHPRGRPARPWTPAARAAGRRASRR